MSLLAQLWRSLGRTGPDTLPYQACTRLNVGCGRNILPDWINLDSAALPGVDIADLE